MGKYDTEIDPERDLKGATPEALARALGRPKRLWPRRGQASVARERPDTDQVQSGHVRRDDRSAAD